MQMWKLLNEPIMLCDCIFKVVQQSGLLRRLLYSLMETHKSPAFHGILHLSTSFYVYLHLQPSASVLFSRYNAEFTMLQAHIATAPKERKDCTSVLMADACRCFLILLAHSLKKASCLLQLLETDETGTLAV